MQRVGVLLICLLLWMGCGPKPAAPAAVEKKNEKPVVSVVAEPLNVGPIEAFVELPTTLETEQLLTVVAEVRGQVEELLVDEQEAVKADQLLARIDYQRRQLAYDKSVIEHENARRTLERQKNLAAKELNTQSDLDAAQIAYDRAAITMKEAGIDLDKASIRAPFDGMIAERHIRKGQFISEGGELFVVVDPTRLRAQVFIPEKDIARIQRGQKAQFSFDALPGEKWTGTVDVISPIIDKATGTFRARIGLEATDERLRVGLFARVRIITEVIDRALLLPKNALVYEGGAPHIFVCEADGSRMLARKRLLALGLETSDYAQVLQGAQAGESVVIKGQNSLKPDQEIRVAE
ncbi:MAG: efflux RND transporter periplasmic adaptor subunit [Acidobacteriota bacterium]|nr:efflux RND transporter periplasmic adaptor subunit [Acidobacteriota bacterium]